MNSFHFPSCFSKIYFNNAPSSLLRSWKRCVPFRFPYWKLHAFLFSHIRNTYPAHLIYLYLITLIMFGDVYKSRRLSFLNYLQPPRTSFFPLLQHNVLEEPQPLFFFSVTDHTNIILNGMKSTKYKHQPVHKHSGTTCNEFILYKYLYM
jgi:hypothetical protein